MKIRTLHIALLMLMPLVASAQYANIESLVNDYITRDGISHTHVGKSMIWMAKAKTPKGAMDGVENIHILKFDNCIPNLYPKFRASADSLFAISGAERVMAEPTKKGSMEVFMERKEHPTEYMTFTYTTKGDTTFMWMSGTEIPSR